MEEDGFELRWVGKREAYHSAFVPVQKIVERRPEQSKHWDTTGNLLIKGDNTDALRLLRQSYFGKIKLFYIDPPYNTQSDAFTPCCKVTTPKPCIWWWKPRATTTTERHSDQRNAGRLSVTKRFFEARGYRHEVEFHTNLIAISSGADYSSNQPPALIEPSLAAPLFIAKKYVHN